MGEPFGELKIDRSLRQKLLDLCHGQTILLVGDTGAGKSTLINSFFSMITGKYQQIAEARFGHQTVTKTLGKYVCQRADGVALTFVDTCGFIVSRVPEVVPDGGKVNFGCLLDALLSGTIRPETDLHRIIESLRKQNRAETPEEEERLREEAVRLLEAAKVKNEKRLEPNTVIVVVDAMFLPPKNYLKAVDEAVMKFSKKGGTRNKFSICSSVILNSFFVVLISMRCCDARGPVASQEG